MAISAQQLTIYLYSAHRAVIFAIAQLSCFCYSTAFLSCIVSAVMLNLSRRKQPSVSDQCRCNVVE